MTSTAEDRRVFYVDIEPALEDILHFIQKAKNATNPQTTRSCIAQAEIAIKCLMIVQHDESTDAAGYTTRQVSDQDMSNAWRDVDHRYDSVTKNNPNEDKAMAGYCKKIKEIMISDDNEQ